MTPKTAAAVLAATLACGVAHAAPDAPDPNSILEGLPPWGSINRTVEPKYPREALDRKIKGHIDIMGRVSPTEELTDVTYEPGSDDAQLLVEPLKEVMGQWRFVIPRNKDCQPNGAFVRDRVWIDLTGDQPAMLVTRLGLSENKKPRFVKVITRVEPKYPSAMLREGWHADVFARVAVAPSGEVLEVRAIAYPKQPGVDLTAFESTVIESLSRWTFNPEPALPRKRYICQVINFRLRP